MSQAWEWMVGRAPGSRTRAQVESLEERLDRQADRIDEHRRRFDKQAERMSSQRERLDRQHREIEKLSGQILRLKERLAGLTDRTAATEKQLRPLEQASSLREVDHYRISAQLGAVEERLADLARQVDTPPGDAPEGRSGADAADRAEARRLVDLVRREHDQVRVRLQVVSAYEERLRRVEAALLTLFDGDPRDPV